MPTAGQTDALTSCIELRSTPSMITSLPEVVNAPTPISMYGFVRALGTARKRTDPENTFVDTAPPCTSSSPV
jgi:hypothetical protein